MTLREMFLMSMKVRCFYCTVGMTVAALMAALAVSHATPVASAKEPAKSQRVMLGSPELTAGIP